MTQRGRSQRTRYPRRGHDWGTKYGVAKGSKLVGVRVLDCDRNLRRGDRRHRLGNCQSPGTIPYQHDLGGGLFQPVNDAVDAASAAGVTVAVAAGNWDEDACNSSPASAKSAITVGATNNLDRRSWFSNWGNCVDILAPGEDIESAWITNDNSSDNLGNVHGVPTRGGSSGSISAEEFLGHTGSSNCGAVQGGDEGRCRSIPRVHRIGFFTWRKPWLVPASRQSKRRPRAAELTESSP